MTTSLNSLITLILVTLLTPPLWAAEYNIAAYTNVPPYIISESDSGIELDLVRAAFAENNHTVTFEHLPFPRALSYLKSGKFDAALTISESAELDLGTVYYSDNHVTFQNVAITLKKNDISINSIGDLAEKSVAAFKYAKEYLGPEFADMANENPAYTEILNTSQLVPMLFAGRVDVVVIEQNIFKYHLKTQDYTVDTNEPVIVHQVMESSPFKVVFTDPDVRDNFNAGLMKLRSDNRYQQIVDKYTLVE